jgi:hypothetical protein
MGIFTKTRYGFFHTWSHSVSANAQSVCSRLLCFSVFFLLLLPGIVHAQSPIGKGGAAGGFEIDANFKVDNLAPKDWRSVFQADGAHSPYVTKIPAAGENAKWIVDGNSGIGTEAEVFRGSSNKNGDFINAGASPYLVETSSPSAPQKNDITNVYSRSTVIGTGTSAKQWVMLGAETRSVDGTSYLDFEYNKKGAHITGANLIGDGTEGGRTARNGNVAGDALFVVDFAKGGNAPVPRLFEWRATGASGNKPAYDWFELTIAANDPRIFIVTNGADVETLGFNSGFAGDGTPSSTTLALQFVEIGVNLTDFGLDDNVCSPNATLNVKTRTSSSYTSELKDFSLFKFSVVPAATLSDPDNAFVCPAAGADASFATTVSGPGASASNVSWYKVVGQTETAIADDNTKYDIVVSGSTSTLTIHNAVSADAGTYRAKLSGATCGTPSEDATLTVNTTAALLDITPLTKCIGEAAEFATTASGTGATAANIKWYKVVGATETEITSGITTSGLTSTLSISSVAAADGGTYRAKLSGATCGTPSKDATLTVNETAALTDVGSQTKCAGTDATFSTTVSGTGASANNVAWYKVVGQTETLIVDDNTKYDIGTNGLTSTLIIHTVVAGDAASYKAKLTSAACGIPDKSNTLTVNTTATLSNLSPQTKCPGANETAIFSTDVSGTGAAASSVEWYFGTTKLANDTKYMISTSGNTSTLTVKTLVEADEGTYIAKLVNATCGAPEKSSTLTINPVPDANAGNDPAAQCYIENGNEFSLNGSSSVNGTALWTVQSPNPLPTGVTVSFDDATSLTPKVTVSGATTGGIVVTLRLTITSNATPACGSDFDDVVVEVKAQATGLDGVIQPITCTDVAFKLKIAAPAVGTTYTVTQPCNGTYNSTGTLQNDGSLLFTGLKFAAGYKIIASKGTCVAAPINCAGTCTDICATPQTLTTNSSNARMATPDVVEATIQSTTPTKVLAAPNPFNDRIRFSLQSSVSGRGSLELYNMLGQKVKVLYQGFIQKGQVQTIEYNVPASQRSNLIYLFRVGDQKVTGKLIGLR